MLQKSPKVYYDLSPAALVEHAIRKNEGILAANGALTVTTGKYTGRSPKDKFIIDYPEIHDTIAWGSINQPMDPERFERLFEKALDYASKKELYVFRGYVGADPAYRMPIRVINEFAWQNLFAHQLFIRPTSKEELANHQAEFTVLALPTMQADPAVDGTHSEAFILVSFKERVVLIGGTHYAGEMKKSIFSVLNYLLPEKNVCPMHCSANMGANGDVALFFGLSGTGKTTLSADPKRRLIGDDEHGWSANGIFNFEGGCYAKCINLSAEKEPQIYAAIRFGSVLENVILDPDTRVPDYDDASRTENTRAAYPIDYIPNAQIPGIGGHPNVVVFLTADAFGVLPPVAKLTPEQAMYHFMSGYTSKLAGTERGITEPQATFSACFGAPFLPRPVPVYAKLLGEKIREHNARVYLINTGWTGGPYGIGKRMNLPYTRAIVDAVLSGELEKASFVEDPIFRVLVPTTCPNVPAEVLQPRNTWQDKAAYDEQARKLARLFAENFAKFTNVDPAVAAAGPRVE